MGGSLLGGAHTVARGSAGYLNPHKLHREDRITYVLGLEKLGFDLHKS
jgi:hypothetical protein